MKALIYFGIALLFLPMQRWLDKLVGGSSGSSSGSGRTTRINLKRIKTTGGRGSSRDIGSGSNSSSIKPTRFQKPRRFDGSNSGSIFIIMLTIALINACIFNDNENNVTTDKSPPLHARVERDSPLSKGVRGMSNGGEVNQAKLDSFTVIMLTHKSAFESQYILAQKTGFSEDYKIAYTLLKPWSRWKDSVSSETKAIKIGNAKAESAHKLEKFSRQLREQQQQKIAAERKNIRDIANYTGLIVFILAGFGGVLWLTRTAIKPRIAELMLLLTFYMLFETLLVYTDTLIDTYIGVEPAYKIVSNTLLAAVLAVLHEMVEKKIKPVLNKLKRRIVSKRK